MTHPRLILLLCEAPEGIKKDLVSPPPARGGIDSGISPNPLLGITPDLGTDGLLPSFGDWIVGTTDPIDEMVSSTNPQPDLESTIVISHPGWLLKYPSPLHGIRA